MQVACTQENLLQGLSLVSHIAGKSANLPILSHVLLKTESGGLKLSTTNLEMAVSAQVRGKVEAEGEFTVPAKLLQDYVSLLPSGKVELIVRDDILEIVADGKKTTMKGMSSSEFPLIPKLAKGDGYRIEAEQLREAISQVVFAVSASESRPELGGVACYFNAQGGRETLVMASTDSYRLTERLVKLGQSNPEGEMRCIVPSKAMQEVARILSAYKDDVATPEEAVWSMSESQLVMNYGSVELITRLIEGSFPDYRQIIPNQARTTTVLSRASLLKAIRAASLFARQGIYDVHLEVGNGSLKISSSDSGTGAHSESLEASVDGDENHVTVNFKYIMDGLSALRGDEAVLSLIDGMNPVLLQEKNDDSYKYIVMPIRQ